jgi:hypothetical protein
LLVLGWPDYYSVDVDHGLGGTHHRREGTGQEGSHPSSGTFCLQIEANHRVSYRSLRPIHEVYRVLRLNH